MSSLLQYLFAIVKSDGVDFSINFDGGTSTLEDVPGQKQVKIYHHPIVLLSSLHCLIGLSITDVDAGVVLHVFDDPLLSYIVIMYKITKDVNSVSNKDITI